MFLDDGEVPMDNNAAEQSIRGFCISKKNQVTIDTIAGAKSSTIIYSIAETAKSNHVTLFKNILKKMSYAFRNSLKRSRSIGVTILIFSSSPGIIATSIPARTAGSAQSSTLSSPSGSSFRLAR